MTSKPSDRLKGAREAMQKFAGVAQDRAPRLPLGGAVSNPSPRSTLVRALAAGLQLDRKAFELGRADGLMHDFWRIAPEDILAQDFDVLAYATGWLEGARHRAKKQEN